MDEYITINPSLPIVDLHRHLEGSMRLTTALEVCQKFNLPLPAWNLPDLQKAVWIDQPVSDIIKIFPRFDMLRQSFMNAEICKRVTAECFEDAFLEGLDYVELRFSPYFMAETHHLSPQAVTTAVCEAWQESIQKFSIVSRLIVILSRTYGPEICSIEMDCALANINNGVVGVDLAGDEKRWPAQLFKTEFDRARKAGLKITAHAGEFAGADSIRETIKHLQPQRLGHAVRAVDDPHLMDEIVEKGIAIECCPTSNYLTASIPSLKGHPLPIFLKHGIKATLNTDDPAFMGNLTIQTEYLNAKEQMGLTRKELELVQINGLESAFLSEDEKHQLYPGN
jgi:adenosine deaminase